MKVARELRALSRRTARRVARQGPGADRAQLVAPPGEMPPIFVGGTGRSGTTITSALIGRHPAYKRLHTEVKFISNEGGLCDLVVGRTTVDEFGRRMRDKWFDRGEGKGLKVILDWASIEAALGLLREEMRGDWYAAAGAFAHRLLDPIAAQAGKRGWIEMTPSAALEADTVFRMFPNMKLLHLVRDGRDVACSVLGMRWGPNNPHQALDWWARRIERAFAAGERLPADRVLVVQLEELLVHDRDRAYERLVSFLGLDDAPRMRTFFNADMPAEAMHGQRWRTDVPPEMLPAFERHYRRIVDRFNRRGYPYHPEPDEVDAGV